MPIHKYSIFSIKAGYVQCKHLGGKYSGMQIQCKCMYCIFNANTVYTPCKYSVFSVQIQGVAQSHDVNWRRQEQMANSNSPAKFVSAELQLLNVSSPQMGKSKTHILTVFKHGLELTWGAKSNNPHFPFHANTNLSDRQTERNTLRPFTEAEFPSFGSQTAYWTAARFCRKTLLPPLLKCIWTVFSWVYSVFTLYLKCCCCNTGFTNINWY